MTDQEIIEKSIRFYGGRISNSEIHEDMAKSYEYVKLRAETFIKNIVNQLIGLNEIDFDIIDNYRFNAFAIGLNHKYFIGINKGTIATLSLVFDRLMADKEVLAFIGDVNKEK